MAKFKPGDRIKVMGTQNPENYGIIDDVEVNSRFLTIEEYYRVSWDNGFKGYNAAYEVDDIWGYAITDQDDFTKAQTSKPTECQHDWKLYQGFNTTYDYCTKCDKKKD